MTRQDILNELKGIKAKVKFYKKSPYQAKRYKPEYVEAEAWIYTGDNMPSGMKKLGYVITGEDYNNTEYRKNFFEMIREEAGHLSQ